MIYNPQKPVGRALGKILLPAEYRNPHLNPQQQSALRAHGMKNKARFSTLTIASNVGRLAGDTSAIWAECFKENGQCKGTETSAAVFDAGVVVPWMGSEWYNKVGSNIINAAEKSGMGPEAKEIVEKKAYELFKRGQYLVFVANVSQLAAGGVKMFIEVDNFLRDREETNPSAFVDGAADAGRGGAYAVYNIFLIKEGAKAVKTAGIREGNNVLAAWSKAIPPRLLLGMRVLGMAGPAISTVTNGYSIYDGATNAALSEEQQTHQIMSGSLGVASSLFYLGTAFFITPASLPVGVTLFAAGSALLVVQTVYDEWESFFPAELQSAAAVAVNPFPALYAQHLSKTDGGLQGHGVQ